MKLTQIPTDIETSVDVTVTRLKEGPLHWLMGEMKLIHAGHRQPWLNWFQFRREFVSRFEPLTVEEMARQQLHTLQQKATMQGYIYKFDNLCAQVETMNTSEAFAAFVRGLKPEIRQQVGVHVETNNLQAAKELPCKWMHT